MTTLQCSYCSLYITDDIYLHCIQCGGEVHIKCLKHASTPGDLLGDVFFDFTCAKCMQQNANRIDQDDIGEVREKFVRQRMPWLLTITIALYNLSIKSKGLSRHGYFHWRTHIVNFIDKNWDYLFDPSIKRRKKWTGSISGALSHNSPKYFTSGQELFDETGWWKLTHSNKTPKYIFNLYEQECLIRQQIRQDKRENDTNYGSDTSNNEHENKRKYPDSDSCGRTIPYMGCKPKVAKLLNVLDDDLLNKPNAVVPLEDPILPLNTVQSGLMDFLAESLASDDLNMFNSLPNIAQEPLVESIGKHDILPLFDTHNDNAKFLENSSMLKAEPMDLNGQLYNDFTSQLLLNENQSPGIGNILKYHTDRFQTETKTLQTSDEFSNELDDDNTRTSSSNLKNSEHEEENEPDTEEEDSDSAEEFKPRIVQVKTYKPLLVENQTTDSGRHIKHEITSDTELSHKEKQKSEINKPEAEEEEDTSDIDQNVAVAPKLLKSLFTRQPKRPWPWLVDNRTSDDIEDEAERNNTGNSNNVKLTMMSEYEEKELLQDLRKIFKMEEKCKLEIPPYIRRFYRKLCVREWHREHGRPVFNLDDYLGDKRRQLQTHFHEKSHNIARYQLISLSSANAKKSFYARLAGSSEFELFESPYTRRVLCPFIWRDRKSIPPFLKLMCHLQYKVNGVPPTRAPIDYCYVRPNHIPAVNALLQTVFWPGIDMSECLSYPDFSVVALYKKLVIGCAFLVPDVGYNEAYISFMAVRPGWQRSGIATFMLYHLIQTCLTKDITLHVSASNPAVFLYQKFGFKIQEIIHNFYDKYLPFDSKQSRIALFLRLKQ